MPPPISQVKFVVVLVDGVKRIACVEDRDRNGPTVSFLLTAKPAILQVIRGLNNVGDEAFVPGEFGHLDDTTAAPMAIFKNEDDADAFLAAKGRGHRKDREPGCLDGYDYKIIAT